MNIEVFKTNVIDVGEAGRIIEVIQGEFKLYKANFDLQDCDRILRVESTNGPVKTHSLVELIEEMGYKAETLPDL